MPLDAQLYASIVAGIPEGKAMVWPYNDSAAKFTENDGHVRLLREPKAVEGVLPSFTGNSEFSQVPLLLNMSSWMRNHLIPPEQGIEDLVRVALESMDSAGFALARRIGQNGGYFGSPKESHGFERKAQVSYLLLGPSDFARLSQQLFATTLTGKPSVSQVMVGYDIDSNSSHDFMGMAAVRFPVAAKRFAGELTTLANKLGTGIFDEKEPFMRLHQYMLTYAEAIQHAY